MADPLSVVSGIAGLISLSGKVLSEGYAFISSVHRAPQELRELFCETAALEAVLCRFQSMIDHGTDIGNRGLLQSLGQVGAIEECRASLRMVKGSIDRYQQIKGRVFKSLGRRIVWPLKEKETKEALARVSRLRGLLSTALTADTA